MTALEARELFAYNRWANQEALRAVQPLTADEFVRDLKNSYPSIRDTLVHILTAEWIWLSRWRGVSPREQPAGWATLQYDELLGRWRETEAEQTRFIDRLVDADISQPIRYTNTRGEPFTVPLQYLLRHVVNHSSYHRGQVTTMLRQLGHSAVSTDLVLYHTRVVPVAAQ